jgi:hypothetical protein
MTPLAEKIRHMLDNAFEALDREKLTRWLMARASNRDLGIVDCHGKPIGVGLGCAFDGTVRTVFWSFIQPCLRNIVQEACDLLDQSLERYSVTQRAATLDATEASLKGFTQRIYIRMVDLDRRMRGRGYPESVAPYDPSREISAAHELVAHKLATLRRHYLPSQVGLLVRVGSFVQKYWQWIVTTVLIPIIVGLWRVLFG